MSDSLVSGKRVAKLMLVEINSDEDVAKGKAKQSNKFYNMYEQNDDTFIAEWGRVDSTLARKSYDISKWDKTLKSKLNPKKGYKDVTHLFEEEEDSGDSSDNSTVADIQDRVVKRLMDELQSFATNSIKANYNVSSRAVTQAMIDEAQKTVDGLVKSLTPNADIDDLNKQILHLYHIIPRKMQNVNSHLFTAISTKDDLAAASKMVENEQDTLDVMAGQVIINTSEEDTKQDPKQNDILTMLGLKMVEGTSADDAIVKKLMGPNVRQFKSCYKVEHIATQRKYDKVIQRTDNDKTELFWHGSRNQNWLNILSTGLMIRPSGAIHNGSMFGDGIYFADKAQKSIGYSSLRGSYWTSGGSSKGYLALFSVHVGNQNHIKRHNSSCYSLNRNKLANQGYDSVFAHGGADLRNNEYIVYDANQCTVSYLVEIGN